MTHPITKIRNRLGDTQTAFAAALGVKQPTIWQLERDEFSVSAKLAGKLVKYAKSRGLLVTYDMIYGAVDVPPQPKD